MQAIVITVALIASVFATPLPTISNSTVEAAPIVWHKDGYPCLDAFGNYFGSPNYEYPVLEADVERKVVVDSCGEVSVNPPSISPRGPPPKPTVLEEGVVYDFI